MKIYFSQNRKPLPKLLFVMLWIMMLILFSTMRLYVYANDGKPLVVNKVFSFDHLSAVLRKGVVSKDVHSQSLFFTDFSVSAPILPSISYATGTQYLITGRAITPLTVTNTGGAISAGSAGGVTSVAGTGVSTSTDNANGLLASFTSAYGMAEDASGNLFVADFGGNKIRKITPAGAVTTFAGTGTAGGTDNAVGTLATFNGPTGLAFDASGNLFVAEFGGHKIRKITPAGVVTTFAGTGTAGFLNNATGTSALFSAPFGVVIDASGNLFVTDGGNTRIRKITPAGAVTTFAGTGSTGSSDNTTGTLATFSGLFGIAIDASGNLYVADRNNNKIRKITPAAVVTTLAGSGAAGSSDNATGTLATFNTPFNLTTDASGNVYLADRGNRKVRKITPEGVVTTFAGSGTSGSSDNIDATLATFNTPSGVLFSASANAIYINDIGTFKVRKISFSGYSISPALPTGLSFDASTGTISGTPTALTAATNYTVTAINNSGSTSTTVNIATILQPVINVTIGNQNGFSSCIGSASPVGLDFAVTGTNLVADITLTAPTGFELSTSTGGVYSNSITLTQSGGTVASTTIYARLAASATGTPSGNIVAATVPGVSTIMSAVSGAVNALPVPVITTVGATAFCAGGSVTLTVATANSAGTALQFSGTQYANVTRNISDDFTIEAWINTTDNSSTGTQYYQGSGLLFADLAGITNDFGAAILNGKFIFGTGNPDVSIQSSTTVTDGQWHHVAAVRRKATGVIEIYVDGVLEGSLVTGNTLSLNAPSTMTIGGNTVINRNFKGLIDEMRVWSVAKTGAEIQSTKNSSVPASSTGLVGYWRFNEGSGTVATDISPAGNSANFLNSPAWVSSAAPIQSSYTWTPATGLNISSGGIVKANPTTTTTYTVTATNAFGCIATAISTITVNPVPTITLGAVTGVGTGASSFSLPYTVITGSPDKYSISSVGPTLMAGFASISNSTLSATPITVPIPASSAKSYTFSITVSNSGSGCVSADNLFTVLVGTPAPIISYANNTQSYSVGTAITPLIITNTGGAVPITPSTVVSKFAGNGARGASADNVNRLSASFNAPFSITKDVAGNFYVTEYGGRKIRKIDPSGAVTTIAGSGGNGSTDNLNGLLATFSTPVSTAVDTAGNIFVSDQDPSKIRKVSITGAVSTVAGRGGLGFLDNSNGLLAIFNYTGGISNDNSGNLYVADIINNKIRKINSAGAVTTFAGNGSFGSINNSNGLLSSFGNPYDLVVDRSGNVFVADTYSFKIRKITPAGAVSTFAGSGANGISDNVNGLLASFASPIAIGIDGSDNLYVVDNGSNRIRKVSTSGAVTTIAGTGVFGIDDRFVGPRGITVDASGNVYVADPQTNFISKITQLGYNISPSLPSGLSFDAATATISGTPTVATPPTNYTVTASNAGGSSSTVITLSTFTATINITGNLSSFKTCSGIVSAPQSFAVSGSNLTVDVNIQAPAGFEIATTVAGVYSSSLTLTKTGNVLSSTAVYIRLSVAATGTTAGGPISCTSAGAAGKSIIIPNNTISIASIPVTPFITSASGLAFCSGSSVVVSSSVATGNQWYNGGVIINGATGNKYTATKAGSYSVIVTNANGCTSAASNPVVTTLNSNPIANVTEGTQLAFANCGATTVSLSANAGAGLSYQWVNDNGNISGATSQQYAVTQPGNYSVRVRDANNCSTQSPVTKILSLASASANGTTAVCLGNSVLLSGNVNGFTNPTFQWLKDGVNISGATSASYAAGVTGSFNVTVTSGGISSSSCPVNITVNALPIVTIAASPGNSVCVGTPLSVNAVAAGNNTYQWLNNDNAIENEVSASVSITASGIYSVQVTDANGCFNTSSNTTVSINALPAPLPISGNTVVDVNSTTLLFSAPTGGLWSSSNTSVAAVNASGTVSGITAGNVVISYTLTNADNCSTVVSTTLTVNAVPLTPTITAGSATNFCTGGSVVLTSSATSGNQWYKDGAVIGGATGTTYTATGNGLYTVVVAGVSSDLIAVGVNPTPDATIQQGSQVAFTNCANTSITLTAANNIPGASYQWRNSSGDIAGATQYQYTVTTADNYSLMVTTGPCSAVSGLTRVTALPTASASGNTVVCSGTPVTLSVDASGFSNPTFQWKNAGSNISGATASTYNPTATGNYTVLVTAGGINSTSCGINVTVNALPTVSITPNTTVCAGNAVSLTATTNGTIYQWLNNGDAISNATSNSFGVLASGQYSLRVTDANGCSNTSTTTTVTINPLPVISAIAGASTVCTNNSIQLSNNTAGGVWSSSNALAATVDVTGNVTGIGAGTTTISFQITTNGCTAAVTKDITVNAAIAITTQPVATLAQCAGTSVSISVVAAGNALSYQWYKNGTTISGATAATYTDNSITASSAGNYTVIISGVCGSVTSNASVWKVNTIPSISIGAISKVTANSTSFNLAYTDVAGSPDKYSITSIAPNAMSGFTAISNSTIGSSPITVNIPQSAINNYSFNLVVTNSSTGCVSVNNPFTIGVLIAPPAITYSNGGTKVFNTGLAITPLTVTNNGGAVPATAPGQVTTFAGSGESGRTDNSNNLLASFQGVFSCSVDKIGNIYVAEMYGNRIRKISSAGGVSTIAGNGIYTGTNSSLDNANGLLASFSSPYFIATDAQGNLYLTEQMSSKIRKINTTGAVTTFAGNEIIASIDNANSLLASFAYPTGIVVNDSGYIFVAELVGKIRKISPSGVVTTFAGSGITGSSDNANGLLASFNLPMGLAIDRAGNIIVSDYGNRKIRKITPSGAVTTLAGSGVYGSTNNANGLLASFSEIYGVCVDSSNNIIVAEYGSNKIRKISPSGAVTTLAGNGTGGSSDNVSGISASFLRPTGVATDLSGNILVTDFGSSKIRKISQSGYSISPTLPAGLSFDSTNGTISGTPTKVTPATNYIITAINGGGSSSTTITISTATAKISILSPLYGTQSCSGTATDPQPVKVVGANLIGDITITAPTGCEISRVSNSGYTNAITLTQSGGKVDTTTIYFRIAATAVKATAGGLFLFTSPGANRTGFNIINDYIIIDSTPAKPIITPNTSLSFCSGGNVTLSSSAASAYQWYLNGQPVTNANSSQYSTSMAGSYTVVTSNTNGCSSVASTPVVVAVNSNPVATIAEGSQLAFANCGATTVSLSANSGNGLTYQWSNDNGIIAGANSQQYAVAQAGNYSVRITDANNCSILSAVTKILSVASATANGNTAICEGNTVLLSANASGFSNPVYQWLKDGKNIGGATGATYSADATGSYSVSVTSAGVSSVSCAINITVNPLPVIVTNASPGNAVCAGTPLSINTSMAGTNTYQWLYNGNAINNVSSSSINILTGGSYSVRVTDANGCINTSAATTVSINALPTPSAISGNAEFTVNSTINLLSTPTGGIWKSSNSSVAMVDSTGTVTGKGAGTATISYTLTNASNCSATVSALVTINALPQTPVITANTATVFCTGGSVVLISSIATGNQWYKDGEVIGGATGSSYSAIADGSYTVVVNGVSSDPISVGVSPIPDATIQQGSQVAFTNCANTSITLTAVNNTPGTKYQWQNANGDIAGATNSTYTVTTADNYTLRVTSGICSAISGTTRVTALPTASVTGNTIVCSGTPVALSVDANGFTNPTFQWKNAGTDITGATTSSFNPTTTGNYTVLVTAGGIGSTSCAINVTVNSLPTVTITPNTTVCVGTNVTLTATTNANKYQWLNSGNAINNAVTNSYSPNNGGLYSLKVTDANGCSNTSSETTVTINPLPVLSAIAGSAVVCENSKIQFTNSTAGGIWSSSNKNIATVDSSGAVRGIAAGSATISYTVTTNGCGTTITKDITVNASTKITTQPVATLAQCAGTSASITVVASGTGISYQWYKNGTLIDGATSATYTDNSFSASDVGNYTVIVSGSCGTITSNASVWSLNPTPDAKITNGVGVALGAAGTVTLNGNTGTGFTYKWFKDGTLLAGQTSSTLLVSQTGSYTLQVTNATGCSSAISDPLVVTALPTASVSGATSFCAGGSVDILITLSAGQTFVRWKDANNKTVGNSSTIYTATTSGSYAAEINAGSGIQTTLAVLVTVNALPVLNIISSITPASVCAGGSITLTASGGSSYQWLKDNVIITGSVNAVYIANSSGAYSVKGTNANGCSATSVASTVTVNALPIAVITPGGNTSFCSGGSVLLSSSSPGGNQWFKDGVIINGANTATYTASASGNYSLLVTNRSGCSTTSSPVTVTVNTLPTASITNGVSLVLGNSGNIALTANTGTGLTYQWYKDGALIGGQTNGTFSVNQTGSYSVLVTNNSGCSKLSNPTSIDALPSANVSGNTTFCNGGAVDITVTLSVGQTFVRWKDANNNSVGGSNTTYRATTTSSYAAEINVNGAGLQTTKSVNVTVIALPVVSISSSVSPASICLGNSLTLTANGGNNYQWYVNNSTINGASKALYTTSTAGDYTVEATNANGCTSVSVPTTVTINELPAATITAGGNTSFCSGGSVILTSSSTIGNQWYKDGVMINGAGSSTYTAISGGNYTVVVTNASGCSTTSGPITVTVNAIPVATITNGFGLLLGSSGSVILTANSGTGLSYQWIKDGAEMNGETGRTLLVTATGSYSVRVTNATGCSQLSIPTVIGALPTATVSGSTSFCAGGSVDITVSLSTGQTLVRWKDANNNTVGGNGLIYTATTSGSYAAEVNTGVGGIQTTQAVQVTVNALPVVNVISSITPAAVCSGSVITLTASGGNSYQWLQNGTAINGSTNAVYVANTTGDYSVRATNANGCIAESAVTSALVSALPTVNVITGISQVCLGSSISFNNTNTGGVWNSSNLSVATINSSGLLNGIASGISTISYSVTNSSGCKTIVTKVITVNDLPVVAAITGVQQICVGTTTALSSTTLNGVWTSSNIAVADVSTAGVVTGITSGVAVINYSITNNNGCATTVTRSVTINALPTVLPITGVQQVCVGSTSLFNNNTSGGTWSSSNTAVAVVNSGGLVTGVSAGTATISYLVTNSTGCSTIVSRNISVNALPVVAAINGNLAICVSGTSLLTNTTAGGLWSTNSATVAAINASGLVTGLQPGTATISYTVNNNNGCVSIVSKDIVVNALPTVSSITGIQQVCAGSTSSFTSTTPNGVWKSSNTNIATINSSGLITGVVPGSVTITYTVTNGNGCITEVTRDIIVLATPTVSAITGIQLVCAGSTTAFSSITTGGVWSSTNNSVATVSVTGSVNGISSGNATIGYTVTNANGCATIVTRDITVNAVPVIAAITGIQQICIGSTSQLSNTTSGGSWSSSNSTIATISSAALVTSVSLGTATISYSITNANGCTTIVTRDVTVNALPVVTATSSLATVSKGLTVQLQAITSGVTIASYSWSPSQILNSSIIANPVARVPDNTTFVVVVTSTQGCTASASVSVIAIEDFHVEPTNVFTPNGDGINDRFVIKNLDQYPNNKLQIFDRNGKVMYEKNNYGNDWDGSLNGVKLSKDTYFYVLTIKGQIVKKGTITLVR